MGVRALQPLHKMTDKRRQTTVTRLDIVMGTTGIKKPAAMAGSFDCQPLRKRPTSCIWCPEPESNRHDRKVVRF